ncbi:MAG: radical SAM protein, partial [Deltaproteobacteria bacterium]|nr:radical SAM protein [Deltaproteobacteria bacterium]
TLLALRGRAMAREKLAAVEALEKAGMPTVLVPTVAKGVNDQELGELVRFGVGRPLVRGLHFQPMTSSGRNGLQGAEARLTLPELLTELGRQTGGDVDVGQAFPPGCEHERCSFHLRFRRLADGRLVPRPGSEGQCCGGAPPKTTPVPSGPAETAAGRDRAVDIILRSWRPGGDREPRAPAGAIPMARRAPDAFDEFIDRAARESFSLTAMAFQDAWTVDLARLRGCCVHVFSPPDRFVPFCAMNLTSALGKPLYRG